MRMKSFSKLIYTFILLIILSSCANNKEYAYIETVDEPSLLGNSYQEKEKEPVTINAQNDSLAYLKAYENFCRSQIAYEMTKEKYGEKYLSIPLRFALYDENGNNVVVILPTEILDSIRNVYVRISKVGVSDD